MGDIERKEQILKEVHYRRDKQWSIFSWTTNLILAAIGGFVTLSSSDYFQVTIWHGGALSLAILFLAVYSTIWIDQNRKREKNAMAILIAILNDPNDEILK